MTIQTMPERILDLIQAEGIDTLFGIPDPSFFALFVEAEKRGWPNYLDRGEFTYGWDAEKHRGIIVARITHIMKDPNDAQARGSIVRIANVE